MAQPLDRWDDATETDGGRGATPLRIRPNISTVDMVVRLWRAKFLMLLVFVPIFALGVFVALQAEEEYIAQSRLLISPGDENIFRPTIGRDLPASALLPDTLELIQTELEILASPEIVRAVYPKFGVEELYPDLAADMAARVKPGESIEEQNARVTRAATDLMEENFKSWTAPESRVITTTFEHKDRLLAERVLSELINQYLKYRVTILAQSRSDVFAQNRADFEGQLAQAEDDIMSFLNDNLIADFDTERATVQRLFASNNEALLENRSRQSVVRGQIETYEIQLASTPKEIDIFVEDSSAQSLTQLQVEREQLLSRYTPESRPVQAIDRQIEQVRAFLESQEGVAGTTRRGPNPIYQNIENSLNNLRSEREALRLQMSELEAQRQQITERQTRIAVLTPEYQELVRKRDLLEANVRNLSEREVEAVSLQQNAERATDNIQVIMPAEAPLEGDSLKMPIALGGGLLAAFTALMAGLFSAFARTNFATVGSAEKTLGLPVLATVGRR